MAEDVKPSGTKKNEPPGGGGVAPPYEPPSIAKYSDEHYHFPTDKVVFGVAAVLVLALLAWGLISAKTLSAVASSVLGGVISAGGWAFVLAASTFVLFAIWLAVSKYGRIPLGRDNERPEFRTVSWIAMMFSAGMGIGLMFYGVGEPLSHFTSPPPGTVEAGTPKALDVAHGDHPLPLDAAPLGDLCRRGSGHRLRNLPPWSPSADQLGVPATAGGTRHRRSVRSGHRHPRDLRNPVRVRRLPGSGRAADRRRAHRRRVLGLRGHHPSSWPSSRS